MRDIMLICHFLGLTMGLGTGFAHAFLGASAAKMAKEDAEKFRMQTLILSTMGHIGIALLLISGFYMITPYWKYLTDMPLLMVKLSLVLVLIVLISLIGIAARKAKKGDVENQLRKMETLGKLTLLVGLAIVVCAVKVFH
ncbi:MAG: hypothetical protein ABJA78_20275 [Ferruginibacter sp.]